ncbi:MAG: OmpA family protein [Chitinophagales bacterium]
MQKLLTLLFAFLLVSTAIAQNTQEQVAVYFDKDKAELSIEAQNKLTQTLQSILNLEKYAVKIEAHTDSDGSATYNRLLSEKRANNVYDFLLLQGMNTQDLQIVAQGETNPTFSNQSKTGQQKNRRVDVFFVSKTRLQSQARKAPPISSFKDLQRLTTTNSLQSFSINPRQEQYIEARKGTKLTIPPNAFLLENGSELPSNIRVQIEVQEAISLEDMLLNNLSTMSGDKMLETAGMVSIEANFQGQKLQLKSGKNIEVQVPKNDINPDKEQDMELFYGVSQEEGSSTDWKPTNEKVKTTKPHPLVEIDLTELESFKSPQFLAPQLTGLQTIPEKPASIKKPYKPHAPKEPKKTNLHSIQTFKMGKIGFKSQKDRPIKPAKICRSYTKI